MTVTTQPIPRKGSREWFKANWIHVVETVGVIAATIGLFHASHQLELTNLQLEQAKQALRATTIFNVQRDGRELAASIGADPKLFRFIYDLEKSGETSDDDLRLRARVKIGQLINFYASLYNQYKAGAIDEKFWVSGLADFCITLTSSTFARSMWRSDQEHPERYQSGFLAEGQTCLPKDMR
jgi:hypothetical protein